jgi:hypothetical protein
MATYGDLKAKIADDLARSDLSAQIADAVNEAIADYRSERFWFNEYRSDGVLEYEVATVSGTAWYDLTPGAGETEPLVIDRVVVIDGTINYTLRRVTNSYIEGIYDNSTENNRPTLFAIATRKLRLWPTPDAVYTVRVLGTLIEPVLADDADTNVWTENAFDLLRHSAVRRLRYNVIRDPEGAQVTEISERIALSRLRRETVLRGDMGHIEPAWCDT